MVSFSFTIFIFGRYNKVRGTDPKALEMLLPFVSKLYPIWIAE